MDAQDIWTIGNDGWTIGIDFGTANIRAAVVRNGEVEVIPDTDGQPAMPSWVTFHGNDKNTFGLSAKDNASSHSDLTVVGVKRLLGRDLGGIETQWELESSLYKLYDAAEGPMVVGEKSHELSPIHIAATLLRRIRFNAERYLMAPVTQATIGLPVWFNTHQRKALRKAAFQAGFQRVDLIPEPTAVFLSRPRPPGNGSYQFIATVDIGAGRCQVGIIRRLSGSNDQLQATEDIKLLAGVASREEIGGDLVDRRLLGYILGHEDISHEGRGLCRLQFACETAKKELLGRDDSDHVMMEELLGATVTRDELETLTRDLVEHVKSCLDTAIKDANITKADVTEVLLAGGATRDTTIRREVKEYFHHLKTRPAIYATGDQSLVKGLALWTAGLPDCDIGLSGPTKTSVNFALVSNAIGVQTSDNGLCHVTERNDTIPSQITKDFIYDTAYQTLIAPWPGGPLKITDACYDCSVANRNRAPPGLDGKIRFYECSMVGPRLLGTFNIAAYVRELDREPRELRLRVTIVLSTIEYAWATIMNYDIGAVIGTVPLINLNEESISSNLTLKSGRGSPEEVQFQGQVELERVSVLERLKAEVVRARHNTMSSNNRDALDLLDELDDWVYQNEDAPVEKYYEQLDYLSDLASEQPLTYSNIHPTTPAEEERPRFLEIMRNGMRNIRKTIRSPRSFMGSGSNEEHDGEAVTNYQDGDAVVPLKNETDTTARVPFDLGTDLEPVQPQPQGFLELPRGLVGFDASLEIDRSHRFRGLYAVPPSRPREPRPGESWETMWARESQGSDWIETIPKRFISHLEAAVDDGDLSETHIPQEQDITSCDSPAGTTFATVGSPALSATEEEQQQQSNRSVNGHLPSSFTSSTDGVLEPPPSRPIQQQSSEDQGDEIFAESEVASIATVSTTHSLEENPPKPTSLPSLAYIPPVDGPLLSLTATTTTSSQPMASPNPPDLTSSLSVDDESISQSTSTGTSGRLLTQEPQIVKSSDSDNTTEKSTEPPQEEMGHLKSPQHETETIVKSPTQSLQEGIISAKVTSQFKSQRTEKVHPARSVAASPSMLPDLIGFESLFPENGDSRLEPYTDLDFERISTHLLNTGHAAWGRAPRLYTVLRLIGRIDLMASFLTKGMSDIWFPFSAQTFPATIPPSSQHQFLRQQGLVHEKSKAVQLENGERKHATFSKDDPLPFKVVAKLGRGAHGSVEKVMSTLSQKEYARKVFRKARGLRSNEVKSFLTEMDVLKKVRHKHLVSLVATYSDPKYFALLMQPVGECNLAEYLSFHCTNNDRLSILRSLFGCLANAVAYLHASEIRHRDVKPQNIIIRGDTAFLADFGIAYCWETLTAGATTTADSGKTAMYAAPEVMRVEPRNEAADVWSLGCVFFEMATVLGSPGSSPKRSVMDWQRYAMERTETKTFYTNVELFDEWAFPNGDRNDDDKGRRRPNNTPFAWALDMLNTDPKKRPTAAMVAEQASRASEEEGILFCGTCCLRGGTMDSTTDDEGEYSEDESAWDA